MKEGGGMRETHGRRQCVYCELLRSSKPVVASAAAAAAQYAHMHEWVFNDVISIRVW